MRLPMWLRHPLYFWKAGQHKRLFGHYAVTRSIALNDWDCVECERREAALYDGDWDVVDGARLMEPRLYPIVNPRPTVGFNPTERSCK